MWRGISLANKCLLLFGGAIVLIVLPALVVPWVRMNTLVDDGQLLVSRQQADVWERLDARASDASTFRDPGPDGSIEYAGVKARRLRIAEAEMQARSDRFLETALAAFRADPPASDLQWSKWVGADREYRYARAVRGGDPASLRGIIILERRPFEAARLLVVNTGYLLGVGFLVLGMAVLVFYLITHKIILSPVRALKATAQRVREGDIAIRSDISTGDEFEELSRTFNSMLEELERSHEQLRGINQALDVKLTELAEANSALFEAARLKGDFVASVSHELRTPMNSIIGFAELMREQAQAELDAGDDSSRLSKRVRYVDNIIGAGRGLLDLINNLLEMARIEAGKAQVTISAVSMKEACEGLLGLMYPLAQRKGIELKLEVEPGLPMVHTDLKKFQQVIFNFLSNAVKFTPGADAGRPGRVTLRAELLPGRGGEGAASTDRLRVSVIDTGPGISAEDQQRLFQKFQQLDAGRTREHAGTGLGLAICKELATILQAEIQVVSDPGQGSMFSLILPLSLDAERAAEQKLEASFRGAMGAGKAWTAPAAAKP